MDSEDIRRYVESHLERIGSSATQYENEIIYIVNYINLLGIPITLSSNMVLFDMRKIDKERMKMLYEFLILTEKSNQMQDQMAYDDMRNRYTSLMHKRKRQTHGHYTKVPVKYEKTHDGVCDYDGGNDDISPPSDEYYAAMMKPIRTFHMLSKNE